LPELSVPGPRPLGAGEGLGHVLPVLVDTTAWKVAVVLQFRNLLLVKLSAIFHESTLEHTFEMHGVLVPVPLLEDRQTWHMNKYEVTLKSTGATLPIIEAQEYAISGDFITFLKENGMEKVQSIAKDSVAQVKLMP
jgi:hypothetical protein